MDDFVDYHVLGVLGLALLKAVRKAASRDAATACACGNADPWVGSTTAALVVDMAFDLTTSRKERKEFATYYHEAYNMAFHNAKGK